MKMNPFIFGRALEPGEIIGRGTELRGVLGRLAKRQSTAIIGPPHVGKTTLLQALADFEMRRDVAGNHFDSDIFSFVDALPRGFASPAEFWRQALRPLANHLSPPSEPPFTPLQGAYLTAQKEQFGTFVLEQLFRRLHENKQRFVLLIDEFDDFLANPALHTAEFYGGLRSLASRAQGFALGIAARQELEELNRCTQEINPHGSPYFNTFTELHLGALTERELSKLLQLGDGRFTPEDRRFIAALSGRHPYLAQIAAAAVWDADAAHKTGDARYTAAGEAFYRETRKHFADTWKAMTNGMKRGVTAVSLLQLPNLLETRAFLTERLADNLADYTADLERLERYGMVAQEEAGWRVVQQGFLWWLADELREQVRQETDFATWLQAQSLDGVFTRAEKQWMGKAATAVGQALGQGVPTLVETLVKRAVG